MISAESLITDIRREFAAVPFPSHCGLHAAMARDDWVDDKGVLAELTRREDFIGDWWNVPVEHLQRCMMALSYLDAQGIAFYLPAYMTALVERPEDFDTRRHASSSQVVHVMLPPDDVPELLPYFWQRLSLIDAPRKRVCRDFLAYLSDGVAYDDYAKQLAKQALAHQFWLGAGP